MEGIDPKIALDPHTRKRDTRKRSKSGRHRTNKTFDPNRKGNTKPPFSLRLFFSARTPIRVSAQGNFSIHKIFLWSGTEHDFRNVCALTRARLTYVYTRRCARQRALRPARALRRAILVPYPFHYNLN